MYKIYPDGSVIPEQLPDSYQPRTNPQVPWNERCGNCVYYNYQFCSKFSVPVRSEYWCNFWESK